MHCKLYRFSSEFPKCYVACAARHPSPIRHILVHEQQLFPVFRVSVSRDHRRANLLDSGVKEASESQPSRDWVRVTESFCFVLSGKHYISRY